MKILCIVPLPPPVTGHSLASQTLMDGLSPAHETAAVNLSLGSTNDGRVTLRRIREVGKVLLAVWRHKRWADAIYFTISESRAGNLKDLLIYLICIGRLRRVFVHLHGGTIGRELFDRHPGWRWVNAAFIRRLGGVIISGPAHLDIFAGMIDRNRVHIVPNSAEDALFVCDQQIVSKFDDATPLRVLYISGMTPEKGYLDLADAWIGLAGALRGRVTLDFAGRFDVEADRARFEDRIAGIDGIRYHGFVDAEEKRRLFAQAHVFCLPTRMTEGQPISILEAYASGCVVVTTDQPGIADVFTDEVNGFAIRQRSSESIALVLTRMAADVNRLRQIALSNRRTAGERYRADRFSAAVTKILEGDRPAALP